MWVPVDINEVPKDKKINLYIIITILYSYATVRIGPTSE